METNAAVVSELPMAEEETKNDEITTGSGSSGKIKKTIIVALSVVPAADHHQGAKVVSVTSSTKTVVPPAADHHHGKVSSVTSSMETAESSSQETKKMMKKKQNRVHVSNNKKPFIFYLNLAKKYINESNEVKLCGLGMAIPTVVTIAEILKRNGFAIQKGIMISTVECTMEDKKGRPIEKAKIEIVLGKAEELETSKEGC